MSESGRGTHGMLMDEMRRLVQFADTHPRRVPRKQWGPPLAACIRRIAHSPLKIEVLRRRRFPIWVIDAVLRERLPNTVRTVV
jgi:hypothetical protein